MKNPLKKLSVGSVLIGSMFFIGICFMGAFIVASIYSSTRGEGSIFEVSRNINMPDNITDQSSDLGPVSTLTHQEIQLKYRELNGSQWKEYGQGILGSHVKWSGKVSDIEKRRVEVDMGNAPLRYVVLVNVPKDEVALISVGDSIEFDGRLQSFHVVKGMNPVLDYVSIQ